MFKIGAVENVHIFGDIIIHPLQLLNRLEACYGDVQGKPL